MSSIHTKRNIQNIDYLHFENGKVIGKVDSEKRPMLPLVLLLLQYEHRFYLEQIVVYSFASLKFMITSSINKEISVLVYITLDSVPTYISSS